MFGSIGSNRKLIVPLMVIALAAIGGAGFRVVKSAEKSRTAGQPQQGQAAQAGGASGTGQAAGQEAEGEMQGSDKIEFVPVGNRDPFSHRSLVSGRESFAGGPPPNASDLSSVLSGSPAGQLAPFAPLFGPGAVVQPGGAGAGAEGAGPAEPSGSLEPKGAGLILTSIIAGEKPLAIITDSSGRKFFASEGENVGAGCEVESIHARSVVLKIKGDRISLWLNSRSSGAG